MKKNAIVKRMESNEKRYAEYEELLIKRDQLAREAGSILTAYTKEFGDMINANFELKIKCIKTKKAISYCHRMMNRGLTVNVDLMNNALDKEMKLYNDQLRDMIEDTKNAKDSKMISEFRLSRARKIYRRLAKILHPDMNGATKVNAKLSDLWDRIYQAYLRSDADELENLEALVHRTMEDLGSDVFEVKIDNIEERIEKIENQINDFISSEPYIYKEYLLDDEKKEAYRDQLQDEHSEYEDYLKTLTNALNDLLQQGGVTITWQMN